jgi:hypothetical protein
MRDSCMMGATLTKIERAGNSVWSAWARPRHFTYVSNKFSAPTIFYSQMCSAYVRQRTERISAYQG